MSGLIYPPPASTQANQQTQIAVAEVIMNGQGTLATESTLDKIYNNQGTVQHAALYTQDGTAIHTALTSGGDYHVGVCMTQEVYASTLNSYTGTLAAGDSFIGSAETTLGVNAIQVSLAADQNCTVYIDQSSDGTNWDISDDFNYHYTLGGNSWTVQAVAYQYRVRVENTSILPTTYMRLATALCPVVEALPRALSSEGNLKVGVYEIEGPTGDKVHVSRMYELKTVHSNRLVGASLATTSELDANFWGSVGVGTGLATTTTGQAVLSTGAGANGSVRIETVRRARYIAGHGNYFRGQVRCPPTTGSNTRRWGAYSTTDGYFFEAESGTLKCCTRKDSLDYAVANGSFNGIDGAIYALWGTNLLTYEIYYTNSNAIYYVNGELINTISGTVSPLSLTLTLPAAAECNNTNGNTEINTLEARSLTVNRLGDLSTDPITRATVGATSVVLKRAAGKLHRIIYSASGAGSIGVFDNTSASGTKIVDQTIPNLSQPTGLEFQCNFYTGMTAIHTGNVSVTWVYE